VREDPERKGLLFAGTERAVYVSFDDGDHWQSLRLNMPASSIRDLIIKGDDLCVGTHGRGFWILDNITPLRQLSAETTSAPAVLFKPQTAWRVRWNMNTDTPLPPDEATGENPPDGAMIDYYVGAGAQGQVTLEIKDNAGRTVRRYSSADPLPTPDPALAIPRYWVRPPQRLSNESGMHRFLWDMRYPPVPGVQPQYPISAVYMNTPVAPTSPWAMPGEYSVVLTVGGKSYSQPLKVVMDPRVKTPLRDLSSQFKWSKQLYDEWLALADLTDAAGQIRRQMAELRSKVPEGNLKKDFETVSEKLQLLSNGPPTGGPATTVTRPSILGVTARLRTLFNIIDGIDAAPTSQAVVAAVDVRKDSAAVQQSWRELLTQDLPKLNRALHAAGLTIIETR
jgi:hypothetical protein